MRTVLKPGDVVTFVTHTAGEQIIVGVDENGEFYVDVDNPQYEEVERVWSRVKDEDDPSATQPSDNDRPQLPQTPISGMSLADARKSYMLLIDEISRSIRFESKHHHRDERRRSGSLDSQP